jgi:prophage antirepressor-like protein
MGAGGDSIGGGGVSDIVRYQEHGLDLACRLEDGQAWVTIAQLAELFGVDRSVVEKHVNNILLEKELEPSTCASFAQVQTEGTREVNRQVRHVAQDMALHVGYRVRSERGADFRRWATAIVKGEASSLAMQPASAAQQALAMAQALVDIEQRQLAQDSRLVLVERALEQQGIQDAGFGYYSVLGWSKRRGLKLDAVKATKVGKRATAVCKANGWHIGSVADARFGSVHTYPEEALDLAWQEIGRSA